MKASIDALFQKIDDLLYENIDKATASPAMEKVSDMFHDLPDNAKRAIGVVLSYFIISLPIILVAIFFFANQSLKSKIQMKQDIFDLSQSIIVKDQTLASQLRGLLNTPPILSKNSLENKLGDVFSSAGIDTSKITVSSFKKDDIHGKMTRIESRLNFTDLANNELMSLLLQMDQRLGVKVDGTRIRKNKNNGLLSGHLIIVHYSKLIN